MRNRKWTLMGVAVAAAFGDVVTSSLLLAKGLFMAAPLALLVDKIDDVPEAQRPFYVEKDGKFHLDVSGIEDTSGLKSALEKERKTAKDEAAARKALEKRYEGIDPEKVRQFMANLDRDDETRLIAEGKIDQVFDKRTEKLRKDYEKKLEDAATGTAAEKKRTEKYQQRVLDNHIRAAATKVGIHPHAIEDALFRARAIFVLDEEGDAVQLGSDGKPVYGKDGKQPFNPTEWLEGMKEVAPHWFPAGSTGGGASGGDGNRGAGGNGSKKTMKRDKWDSLPPLEKAATAKTHLIID